MRRILPVAVLLAVSAFVRPALPCGPGVHAIEGVKVLDLLAAQDPAWAAVKADPMATSYVVLGTIAPDLQWWIDGLTFGHENSLSYGLIDDSAALAPRFRAMALGHLAHATASDPSCEQFWAPTLVASAPVGMVDVFKGDESAEGATSGFLSELYGDFILGDWDLLVDALFDFYLDGPEAKARMSEAVDWYCGEGKSILGKNTDCTAVTQNLLDLFKVAEQYLGSMSRDDAKAFIGNISAQSLPELIEMLVTGGPTALLGKSVEKSDYFDEEVARAKAGPLVDPAYWQQYPAKLADTGPHWALERLKARNYDWPAWNGDAIVSGNVQSMMRYLPDDYAPRTGLLVDRVAWQDAAGKGVAEVSSAAAATQMSVTLRFYSSLPYQGTLRGVVRKDLPGHDTAKDPVVGEASVTVDIDPLEYITTPRSELTIPFTADVGGAIGFYFELYDGDATKPCFTSSWDRLWHIADLPLDHPIYRDNFGTYGHYPPSLPIAQPDVQPATLFVVARVAPAGPGFAGANAILPGEGESPAAGPSGKNGIMVFDALAAGPRNVKVKADGYQAPEVVPTIITLAAQETRWLDVFLDAVPQVKVAAAWQSDRTCLPFTWDVAPFAGQAAQFVGWVTVAPGTTPAVAEKDLGLTGQAKLCLPSGAKDGDVAAVHVRARYKDQSPGVEGTAEVHFDGSAPEVVSAVATPDGPEECAVQADTVRPFHLVAVVREPDSPIVRVEARGSGGEWGDIAFEATPADADGRATYAVAAVTDCCIFLMQARFSNAAGLSTETADVGFPMQPVCVPEAQAEVGSEAVVEATPDVAEGVVDAGAEPVVEEVVGDSGGGCSARGPSSGAAMVVLLLLAASVGRGFSPATGRRRG